MIKPRVRFVVGRTVAGRVEPSRCGHLDWIGDDVPLPEHRVCLQCVARGDRWVHLRQCLECGQVGCCDSSDNTHATRHAHAEGHPIARSIEPGDDWMWCYLDEVFIERVA